MWDYIIKCAVQKAFLSVCLQTFDTVKPELFWRCSTLYGYFSDVLKNCCCSFLKMASMYLVFNRFVFLYKPLPLTLSVTLQCTTCPTASCLGDVPLHWAEEFCLANVTKILGKYSSRFALKERECLMQGVGSLWLK